MPNQNLHNRWVQSRGSAVGFSEASFPVPPVSDFLSPSPSHPALGFVPVTFRPPEKEELNNREKKKEKKTNAAIYLIPRDWE